MPIRFQFDHDQQEKICRVVWEIRTGNFDTEILRNRLLHNIMVGVNANVGCNVHAIPHNFLSG